MIITDRPTFATDRTLRRQFCTREALAHPAKLHLGLLLWIVERYTAPGDTICDPMAGIGSTALAALMQRNVILRELEPGWVAEAHRTAARVLDQAGMFAGRITVAQADAMQPWDITGVDVVLTSPPYGCRVSHNPNARVGTLPHRVRALTDGKMGQRWAKYLEKMTPGVDGGMRFHYGTAAGQVGHLTGARYWTAMETLYVHAYDALRPGGLLILVLKDHIRRGERVLTCDRTIELCEQLGFVAKARHARHLAQLSLWQRRRRERGEPVVEEEEVLVLERR